MLKILLTIFICILIPVYWKNYGVKNFLWLSDIGLFLTFFALWFDSPLLISMAVIGIFPMELIWIVDYCFQLVTGRRLFGMTDYMFETKYSLFLRGLSLFHIAIPMIWLIYLFKWGYDTKAFIYFIPLFWLVMILTYFFSSVQENINWVFIPKVKDWHWITSWQWLLLLMIACPIGIFLPMHWLLTFLIIK